ncbi:MAG: glycosyltransferase, partial [Geminicoccaceae bacterium]
MLLVAGEGPQEPELRALAGERVRLLGQVPDLGPLFAAADVYLA